MFPPSTRILILDDMPTIREMVRTNLKNMGFTNIWEAEDGTEGLKILQSMQTAGTPIRLVISDWNMPKMKGIDLLRMVRGMDGGADLPFLLLTSESERDQVTEAVIAGVSQYIVKPFSPKTLDEKLKAAWQKHNPGK
ncbi:MAG: response regulator [Pseudobdellovibrionaceae bacterium]